jgi:hypothetical protein
LDRAGGSASKADNRFPERHLMLQRNRRFPVPVFSPSMWAGRKFQSCARRCKKFLRNSDPGSPPRDTSSQLAAEVREFSCGEAKHSHWLMHRRISSSEFCSRLHYCSGRRAACGIQSSQPTRLPLQSTAMVKKISCALNSERKAAVSNAADIHKRGVGILEQAFNHQFRFTAIHNLRVDDVVI